MKISGPGQSSLLLLKVIKLLNKWRVPYAIVGAFACGVKDIDDGLGALRVSSDKLDLPLLKRLTFPYGKKELKKLEEILKNSGHER